MCGKNVRAQTRCMSDVWPQVRLIAGPEISQMIEEFSGMSSVAEFDSTLEHRRHSNVTAQKVYRTSSAIW